MNAIESLLLRRRALVFVEPAAPDDATAASLSALEERLLQLGFLLHHGLRQALATQPGAVLDALRGALYDTLAAQLGADVAHVPLLRGFREHAPSDTEGLYWVRVLSFLLQRPEQPCVMCGQVDSVHALKPCGHLICRSCWAGEVYAGCPTCNRHLDPDEPFLLPSQEGVKAKPVRLRLLYRLDDPTAEAQAWLRRLLARATPLSPDDSDALRALVEGLGLAALPNVPEAVPVRETLALVFGQLLRAVPERRVELLSAASGHIKTATDVLRLFTAWSNDDAALIDFTAKFTPAPRALRRWMMATLDALPFHLMIEDLHRHPQAWKAVARHIRAFDYGERSPKAAAALAALRRTQLNPEDALGRAIARIAEAHPELIQLQGGQVRWTGWGAQVEAAFKDGEPAEALRLLRQRPGELLRRLDHLLRALQAQAPELLPAAQRAVAEAAPEVSPQILLSVAAHLRTRGAPWPSRVYLPKGGTLTPQLADDTRAPLPAALTAPIVASLQAALLERAAALPRFSSALLDPDIAELVVPFAQRSASRALLTVPRGSTQPLPEGRVLRLFLHWMQDSAEEYVDLDLSVGFFDARWRYKDHVSYTKLRLDDAALHSGDWTNAPPPKGASEFVDLDVEALLKRGVRYAAFTVFRYSGQLFDAMPRAFAGFMSREPGEGLAQELDFDPTTVMQRFDLTGATRLALPLLIDLRDRSMLWTDVSLASRYDWHSIEAYADDVSRLYAALDAVFRMGTRPSMWELACLHAAARCDEVRVLQAEGEALRFVRGEGEAVYAFFSRLHAQRDADGEAPLPEGPSFAAAIRAELPGEHPLSEGSALYALRWSEGQPAGVERLEASDLLSV